MEVNEKQMFFFRSVINGTPFEFGRVGISQQDAATTLANDLQKFVDELREISKGKPKSN